MHHDICAITFWHGDKHNFICNIKNIVPQIDVFSLVLAAAYRDSGETILETALFHVSKMDRCLDGIEVACSYYRRIIIFHTFLTKVHCLHCGPC